VKRQRACWRRRTRHVKRKRFISLDESSPKTNMKRLYGWARKAQRLVDAVPGGHWGTTTMLSAIRSDRVAAAMVTDGPVDGLVFLGFIEHFLVPVLRPGDIVVMDNLNSHKVTGVREAIEALGAEVWYLPPYSPDLNPIEQMWSKVKAVLRRLARRTAKALYRAVGYALRQVTSDECRNYFANCGYAT
jgi:transposase